MAPVRPKKRVSDQRVPLKMDNPSTPQRSPIKKRRGGISLQQKQALINNLQLELTERARRLRAQYNLQAQGLRSRIEIRINRIPMSLRKLTMGELMKKYSEQEEKRLRPPVPAKDQPTRLAAQRLAPSTRPVGRAQKRMSDAISGDKENEIEQTEGAKKRPRAGHPTEVNPVRAAQILSPTSSNSRINRPRPVSPIKSQIARPASPVKTSGVTRPVTGSAVLSNMVEKAKATRAGATRKVTATSSTSSSSTGTTAATRTRRAAATTAPRAPASRPATRNARRTSANSETSEASTGTVVKRGAASKPAPARKGVMSSIKKGVTGATKKTTTKSATNPAPATSTGRVLRSKRG